MSESTPLAEVYLYALLEIRFSHIIVLYVLNDAALKGITVLDREHVDTQRLEDSQHAISEQSVASLKKLLTASGH